MKKQKLVRATAVRAVFYENNKVFFPQVFLDEFLYEI